MVFMVPPDVVGHSTVETSTLAVVVLRHEIGGSRQEDVGILRKEDAGWLPQGVRSAGDA